MTVQRQVREVMTTNVAKVGPDTPFKAVAVLLASWGVSGAPVVDEEGRVIGVVSQGDLLERKVSRRRFRLGSGDARHKAAAIFTSDLMSSPAVTVCQDSGVEEAARLLEEHHFHRLPVTDADGKLVGVVSRPDLLRVFLRTDREIREEVRDQVIEQAMCLDPHALYVSVHNGVVSVSGSVERTSIIPLLTMLIGRVDGVVEVREQLVARLDDRGVKPVEPTNVGVFKQRKHS